MHSRKRLRDSSRCKMQFPSSSRQPVSCSFHSTARRSHRMVPTSNLQLASSLLGHATILGSETSCCGGPYWTVLPPGSCRYRGADAPQFPLVCSSCRWPLTGHCAASRCRHLQVVLLGCQAHESVGVGVRYARIDPRLNRVSARPATDAAWMQYLRNKSYKTERRFKVTKASPIYVNVCPVSWRPHRAPRTRVKVTSENCAL